MNAELHAKMSSTINGSTAAVKTKSSQMELNGSKDKTSPFKDMLKRSIKDPGQPAKERTDLTAETIKALSLDEKLSAPEIDETVEDSLTKSELTVLSPEMENPLIAVNENDLTNLLQSKAMGFTILRTNPEVDGNFKEKSDAAIEGAGINQLKNKLGETTQRIIQLIQTPATEQPKQLANTQESIPGRGFNEIYSEESKANSENLLEQKSLSPTDPLKTDDPSATELNTIGVKDQTNNPVGLGAGITENSDESGEAKKNGFSLADSKETQNALYSAPSMLQVDEQAAFGKTDTEQESMGPQDENTVPSKEIQGIPFANVGSEKAPEIQPNNPVALAGQIEQEILSQLDKNKPVKFMMSLEPDNLGKIDIELKFDQGKLTIDIKALSKETQNLLSAQVDKLIKGLALQNVQVENVQLNSQTQERINTDPKTLMMNMGMDFNQGQKQELWKENIMNQNNRAQNGSLENTSDASGDNLEAEPISTDRSRRINYLV